MPRRNLAVLLAAVLIALICHQRAEYNPYGRILTKSLNLIERNALDPVGEEKLFKGAMQGMIGQLGDENSSYVPPVESRHLNELLDGEFEGVGLEVTLDPQTRQLTVLSPLYGSPAAEAGVRAGDKILRINDRSTQGLSLTDGVALIRGKRGQPVTLMIQHLGEEKPVEVKIVRGNVLEETVLGESRDADGSWNYMLPGKDRIGYVRISSFSKNTAEELKQVLHSLTEEGVRGLILDLRNNPGGIFSAAAAVCNLFVKQGVIVTRLGRHGRIMESVSADGDAPYPDLPLAVLVNQNSASASEIVAACLQDHHRAAVIGQRTYGKGTVQQIFELDHDAGSLRLTTSSYGRPSGKNINRRPGAGKDETWGVRPDPGRKVALDNDELARWFLWRARRDVAPAVTNGAAEEDNFVDRQREKAVEYLQKKIKD
ncbi:MAG: S41 family peptidase [Pirellulales bacterium]|nr:S41 family peptidase [Pirellulales bacterium]